MMSLIRASFRETIFRPYIVTVCAFLTLLIVSATSAVADFQISTSTKTCQARILTEVDKYTSSSIRAYSKCLNSAFTCFTGTLTPEAKTSCLAKLIVPGTGDCAKGKLDSGLKTIGSGAASLTSSGSTALLDSALRVFVDGLTLGCFSTPPADLSTISAGLGFPSGLADAYKLVDELNRVPGGLGCLAIDEVIEASPRAQEVIDALRTLDDKCVAVKKGNNNLYLAPCASNSDCGADGLCGKIAYALDKDNIACTPECRAGTVAQDGVCTQCEVGSYSSENAVECTLCEPGTFANLTGLSSCLDCAQGSYASEAGSSECTKCGVGQFSSTPKSTSCQNCSPGYFSNSTGSITCQACAAGTFTESSGSYNCLNCAPGTYSAQSASTSCLSCSAGQFSGVGATACTNCPIGTFSGSGSSGCTSCPPGTSSGTVGSTTCSPCAPGYFSIDPGQALCTSCPAGKFSPLAGAYSCLNCPAGTYSDSAATACSSCPVGTFSDVAASSCSLCPVGTFSDASATSCTLCPVGTSSATSGAGSCNACAPGTYADQSGQVSCILCAPGTYSNLTGASSCLACPDNSTSSPGQTVCSCNSGYIAKTVDGTMQCSLCPEGADCSSPGTTWENVVALPGWWRSGEQFYRCLLQQSCPGGSVD